MRRSPAEPSSTALRAAHEVSALSSALLGHVWAPLLVGLLLLGSASLLTAQANSNPAPTNSLTAPQGDVLQFIDGATLHGSLGSMNRADGVGWVHPDVQGPILFRPTNLAWVRFAKSQPLPTQTEPICRLRFNNGDEVFGTLQSMDATNVEMTTWFGGTLKTERDTLQSATFLTKGFSMLYEGPSSEEGWVHGKSPHAWEYRDGAFVATGAGTLGRDFHMTGSSSFAFDLAWNGHFSLILALYTSVLDRFDYASSSYMFYLSPGYVTLQRVQGGAGAMNLGQAQITEMNRRNRVHVEIRANQEDSSLALLIDDRLVQRWKDTVGFVGRGSGAVFFAQLDGPSIRISNLKVAHWEGDLNLESLTNAPTKDDLVYLVNHDRVTGRVQSLQEGHLRVEPTGQAALDIPLVRVTQIALGAPPTNAVPVGPWQVRAYFAGGGAVSFDLTEWSKDRVAGTSRNFGPVQFAPQYIRQLQFNLERPRRPGPEEMEILDEEPWDIE